MVVTGVVIWIIDDGEIGLPTIRTSSCSELCGAGKVTAMECSEGRRRSAELTVQEAGLHSADMSAGVACDVSLVEMVLLTSRAFCAGCCAAEAALPDENGCAVRMHGRSSVGEAAIGALQVSAECCCTDVASSAACS